MGTYRRFFAHILCASVLSIAVLGCAFAQDAAGAQTQEPEIGMTEIAKPVFPALARQARIMGDVQVQLKIRRDGSVASAEVLSGHPMLKQAAIESAQKLKFRCQGCVAEETLHSGTYTFGFRTDSTDCGYRRQRSSKCLKLWRCGKWQYRPREPVVGESNDRILVLADMACVETSSLRSATTEPSRSDVSSPRGP